MNRKDAKEIVAALRRGELDVRALGRLLDYILETSPRLGDKLDI